MRYAVARYQDYQRDMAYRIYTTDCQRIIVNALAGSEIIQARFASLIYPRKPSKQEERTGDEIAADVLSKICGGDP